MPSQVQVQSGYPVLPFHVNDVGQDSLFSITVASGAGSGNIPAGTVMAKSTTSGEYEPYDNGTAAIGTAVGILVNDVDPSNGQELGSLMIMGVVRSGSLYGFDANAMTDLEKHFFFV